MAFLLATLLWSLLVCVLAQNADYPWKYDSAYTPKTRTFTWDITTGANINVDDRIFINREAAPSPLRAIQGDTISLTVNVGSGISEGVTLHAHGLWQTNANEEDGPSGIVQCPILGGNTHKYTWKAEQCGTYWIHSHVSGQYPRGIRVPLIIMCKDFDEAANYYYDYAKDFTMSLTESFGRPFTAVERDYRNKMCCNVGNLKNCGIDPAPEAAVINGDTSRTPFKFILDPAANANNPTFRVRIINMAAFASFWVFSPDKDVNLEIIEMDGVALSRAVPVKRLEVHPGQRYSVRMGFPVGEARDVQLVAAIDPARYASAKLNPNFPNPAGLKCVKEQLFYGSQHFASDTLFGPVRYQTANFNLKSGNGVTLPAPTFGASDCDQPHVEEWGKLCWYSTGKGTGPGLIMNWPEHVLWGYDGNDDTLISGTQTNLVPKAVPRTSLPIVPSASDMVAIIRLTENGEALGRFATMNDQEFAVGMHPAGGLPLARELRPKKAGTCSNGYPNQRDGYFDLPNTYQVDQGKRVWAWVISELGSHPFHVHGADFQVIEHGAAGDLAKQTYWNNPDGMKQFIEAVKRNAVPNNSNPPRRDTMWINSRTYSLITWEATNPGIWLMHCHNDFHAVTGMMGMMVVHPDPSQTAWNTAAVGDRMFRQCRDAVELKPAVYGNFISWDMPCCESATSCPDKGYLGIAYRPDDAQFS